MHFGEPETKEDIRARMELLDKESRSNVPKLALLFILILAILALYQYSTVTSHIRSIGRGNPYNCQQCKDLGYACKNHENFDKEVEIKNRAIQYIQSYSSGEKPELDETSSQYAMWGTGYSYNQSCDFCVLKKSECYACRHDRLVIAEKVDTISSSDIFQTRLCDTCWKDKIPTCNRCVGLLAEEVAKGISGDRD